MAVCLVPMKVPERVDVKVWRMVDVMASSLAPKLVDETVLMKECQTAE